MRRYLLDQHIDRRVQKGLLQRTPELVVWCIGDPGAPPLHSNDAELLRWCQMNEFTLVTNNRATMPIHLAEHLNAGAHVPGIFVLRRSLPIGVLIEQLHLIAELAEPDEFADQLTYIPL